MGAVAAQDGEMPSFASPGARAGYTLSFLTSRVRKVADTLRLRHPGWLADALGAGVVVSLGGGADAMLEMRELDQGPKVSGLLREETSEVLLH